MRHPDIQLATRPWQHWQIKELVVVISLAIAFPILIHLIPYHGTVPLGARLLSIFYAPLIAALLFRPHVSIVTALLAPSVNYLLTGSPQMQLVVILTCELLVFSLFILSIRKSIFRWMAGSLAYVFAKAVSVIVLLIFPGLIDKGSAFDFGINSILNGITGLGILLILGLLISFKNKLSGINRDGE